MSQDSTTTQVEPAVTTGPKPVSWAPVPKVNLLPVEIVENRAFRRTQFILAGVVALAVAAVGVGTVWAQNGVDDAQVQADAAQARVSQLQQQQTEYAEVPKIYAQVEAATSARKQAYVGDVPWYRYLNQIDRARPTGVDLSNIQMTMVTPGAAAADLLSPSAAATITVDGTSQDYSQVADWMEAFDKVRGLQSSALKSAARQAGVTTFSTTGQAGSPSLSGRYQKPEPDEEDAQLP